MATPNQRRWKCGHCGSAGWSGDGAMPAHDQTDGRTCRPSGQAPEAGAKRAVAADIRAANEHELICSETAYGKTVGYDFFLKVF
jgi:hypothetical protein